MKFLLFTLLLTLWQYMILGQDDYCFGKDQERLQTRQFTSKTAYEIIKGTNIEKQFLLPGCEPKKMWIFHRHGTRLPTKHNIEAAPRLEELRDLIVKNYRVFKTKPDTDALCSEDLIGLQMWKWNNSIIVDNAEYLTAQGYQDMRGTAKTYQRYYPNVLIRNYNNTYYLFRHTDTQRTQESFRAFAEGLFGSNNAAEAENVPEKDLLLRPYDYCQAYQDQNYKGPGSESYKFRESNIWNNTVADISKRLGFKYSLAADDIELMYDICRYEQAWHVDRTSAWCAAFLPEHVTVLEYEDDLRYYYKSGYGNEDNTRINCRAVQDMLTHLDSPASPHVVVYFGHSTGVQTLISALGINKDDIALKADNYNSLTNRRWKTSYIDPFAANFVAVKYQCMAAATEAEKVIFFLNQDAVQLDWCNVGLCNWSEVKKRYAAIADADCNEYYCRSGAATLYSSRSSIAYLLVTFLFTAAYFYLIH